MATTVERHVHEAGDSGMPAVAITVVVLAVVVLLGFFLFSSGAFPISNSPGNTDINVTVPGTENRIPDASVTPN